MKFEDILTNDDLLDALYDMHFDECTPIQELSIPPVLAGHDFLQWHRQAQVRPQHIFSR